MCPTNFLHFQYSHLHPPKFHNSYKVPWMGFLRKHSIICWVSMRQLFFGPGGADKSANVNSWRPAALRSCRWWIWGGIFQAARCLFFCFSVLVAPWLVVQVVDVLTKGMPPKDRHPGRPHECWGMPKPMDRILKITSRQLYPCQMNGVEHPMSKFFKRNLIRTKLFWRVILLGFFFR